MNKPRFLCLCLCVCLLASCLSGPSVIRSTATGVPVNPPTAPGPTATARQADSYQDARLPAGRRAERLLAQMTLEEKIGQMTQIEKNSITPEDVAAYFIGSVLSGGGGSPPDNTPKGWAEMVDGFQRSALDTRLAIPLLYGVDAVHGHGNLKGATLFPHNIGLGAAGDPVLVERIGRATAEEMIATGIFWNFAPVVAVPQDIRWGRTYEGYRENTGQVAALGAAYIRGLQGATPPVAATAKHFIGDGGTAFGTSTTVNNNQPYLLDQGDMQLDEDAARALFLPPYRAAVDAGALSLMVSFSSWNGTKMHAQEHLLIDVLRGELGFQGLLVSDWQAIDQIPGDYYADVVTSINAGLDMIMVPYDYRTFISTLTEAVEKGDVPMSRIDQAVTRILTLKFQLGLFERPFSDPAALDQVGTEAHRALAREAVRKSLVLLKNAGQALPVAKDTPVIFVAGQAADDVGLQSGGWTIQWQGVPGSITPGTTILDGIRAAVDPATQVEFDGRVRSLRRL
jgi:beta-glucosidase